MFKLVFAVTYDAKKDPYISKSGNAKVAGPARNWYALQAGDLGAKELPTYGRALRVRLASNATPPLTMVVVPVGETDDSTTRTLVFDQSGFEPYGVRRIVSLNGGATLPTGVSIDVITE